MADIYGTPGNDTLTGTSIYGNRIYGYDGDDILYGGNGNDSLAGNVSFNDYYGGAGADKFVFANVNESSYIYDFNWFEGDRIFYGSTDQGYFPSGEIYVDYSISPSGIDIIIPLSSTTIIDLETIFNLETNVDFGTSFDPTTNLGSDIF